MKVSVRWMVRRDMAEVLEIEKLCFPYHWTERDFIQALRQRNVIGLVVECMDLAVGEGPILGFIIYELHATRIHILNIAVRPSMHGRGVGRKIVEKMFGKLTSQRRVRITAEVVDSNLDAQLFFKRMGFRAVSILHQFYEEGSDAYLFQYSLPSRVEAALGAAR